MTTAQGSRARAVTDAGLRAIYNGEARAAEVDEKA